MPRARVLGSFLLLAAIVACSTNTRTDSSVVERIGKAANAMTLPPVGTFFSVAAGGVIEGNEANLLAGGPLHVAFPNNQLAQSFQLGPSGMRLTTGYGGTIQSFDAFLAGVLLCVDGDPSSHAVQLLPCTGAATQEWQIINQNIQLALAPANCLDIDATTGNIVLNTCNGTDTQNFVPHGFPVNLVNGAVTTAGPQNVVTNCLTALHLPPVGIVNPCNQLAQPAFVIRRISAIASEIVSVADGSCATIDGQNVFMEPCAQSLAQQWSLDSSGRMASLDTGLSPTGASCLSVAGSPGAQGGVATYAPCSDPSPAGIWWPQPVWPVPSLAPAGGACAGDNDCQGGLSCVGGTCMGEELSCGSGVVAQGDIDMEANLVIRSDGTWSYTGYGHFDCGCNIRPYGLATAWTDANGNAFLDLQGFPFEWWVAHELMCFSVAGACDVKTGFIQNGVDSRIQLYWSQLKQDFGCTTSYYGNPNNEPEPPSRVFDPEILRRAIGLSPPKLVIECEPGGKLDGEDDAPGCYPSDCDSNDENCGCVAIQCVGGPSISCNPDCSVAFPPAPPPAPPPGAVSGPPPRTAPNSCVEFGTLCSEAPIPTCCCDPSAPCGIGVGSTNGGSAIDDTGSADESGSGDDGTGDDGTGDDGTGDDGIGDVSADLVLMPNASTPVAITANAQFSLSVSVVGLVAGGLLIGDGTDDIAPTVSGTMTFPTTLASGSTLTLAIEGQPAQQVCTFQDGQTVTHAQIGFTNLTLGVRCATTCPPACTNGSGCSSDSDCLSSSCVNGKCAAPTCSPSCLNGSPCGDNADCLSATCESGICAAASCAPNCANGSRCGSNSECRSSICSGGLCLPACEAAYAQNSCFGYVQGVRVSEGGHNWLCSNGNCANCSWQPGCVPGATGCPWGIVWTDQGACGTPACSGGSCGADSGACASAYAQSSCTGYVQGTQVSSGGHNWLCSDGNCANCASQSGCAPGATGCPWGVVWTDLGACQ